jgi:hypothetical protein
MNTALGYIDALAIVAIIGLPFLLLFVLYVLASCLRLFAYLLVCLFPVTSETSTVSSETSSISSSHFGLINV